MTLIALKLMDILDSAVVMPMEEALYAKLKDNLPHAMIKHSLSMNVLTITTVDLSGLMYA